MMKLRNKLSLNKMIISTVLVGHLFVSLLLLLLDWFLVSNYHSERNWKREERLETCVGGIEKALEEIDNWMYQIWLFDDNFDRLSRSSYLNGEFNEEMYELSRDLDGLLTMSENFQGYFVYFNGEERCRYKTNLEDISFEQAEKLSRILAFFLEEDSDDNFAIRNHCIPVMLEDDLFLSVCYRKEKATVFAVYNVRKSERDLESMENGTSIIYYGNGGFLSNEELGKNLEMDQIISEQRNLLSKTKNGWKLYGRRVQGADLWISVAVPMTLWDYFNVWMLFLLIAELIFSIFLFYLERFVRSEVVYPLRGLVEWMNGISNGEEGEFEHKDYVVSELQNVDDTLKKMITELREQKMQNYENLIEKQKAIMQYLQLQLKPHFYLNGLKTLNVLAENRKIEKMQELIGLLANHIRYLIYANDETVMLSEELDFCENYIELRKKTCSQRIKYCVYRDDGLDDYRVPTLCIQTFLENSCKYVKIDDPAAVLQIDVSIRLLKVDGSELLNLIVRDNGQGYAPSVLEQVRNRISLSPGAGETNVGINNIRRRCQILYGEKVEFSIYNEQGAVSEFLIPAESDGFAEQ